MAKILVFSGDSSAESDALGLVMEFGGHRCTSAHSLEGVLTSLQQDSFDLVVLNLELNDGVLKGIVKLLKEACPRIAVIILSERGDIATEADEVLAIPCTPEQLFHRIQRSLEKSAGLVRQVPPARRMSPQHPSRRSIRRAS